MRSGGVQPTKQGNLITEYKDFLTEYQLQQIWGHHVCQAKWKFGQKSNNDTVYPMWFQHYYNCIMGGHIGYTDDVHPFAKEVGDRFLDIIEITEPYVLIRNMIAGNTFGQDGDIHKDWVNPGESITGVLYLNRRWEDNWGGETIVYREDSRDCEISKFEAGKLVIFDSERPHIGHGPQRACGELRCIIAVQAVTKVAWDRMVDKKTNKS